jgi:hypothetical protein
MPVHSPGSLVVGASSQLGLEDKAFFNEYLSTQSYLQDFGFILLRCVIKYYSAAMYITTAYIFNQHYIVWFGT